MSSDTNRVDTLIALLNNQLDNLSQATAQNVIKNSVPPTIWTSELAVTLSIIILIFGVIVFGLMAFLINKGHEANDVLRVCSLPLIIISAIFLIVVGYSQQQIAPVMGLLGTVAGYLLGNSKSRSKS